MKPACIPSKMTREDWVLRLKVKPRLVPVKLAGVPALRVKLEKLRKATPALVTVGLNVFWPLTRLRAPMRSNLLRVGPPVIVIVPPFMATGAVSLIRFSRLALPELSRVRVAKFTLKALVLVNAPESFSVRVP